MAPRDHQTDVDIEKLSKTLQTISSDLLTGKGFAIPLMDVMSAVGAGKRLAGQDGAGKEVFVKFLGELVRDHPEVIDVAFAGLSEVAKTRIRKACGGPGEIKDAERV